VATAGHDPPLAIGQRQDLDGHRVYIHRRVRREQDRLAAGQQLGAREGHFLVAQSQDDLGWASTGGHPDQAPRKTLADKEAALLTPMRAADLLSGDVPDRHHGAAFHGDLVQPVAGGEGDPLPVRREERHRRALRPRELGGCRLIQQADEQPRRAARRIGQPRAIRRDRDAAPGSLGERHRHIRAEIDVQPYQRPIQRRRAPRRPQCIPQRDGEPEGRGGPRPGQRP
jgi:hypothetical protein